MRSDIDLKLPKDIIVKDPQAAIQAILNLCRDAKVIGRAGSTNLSSVRCNVEGLTLGHWYKLWDALGPDVCKVIEAVKAQQPEQKENHEHNG